MKRCVALTCVLLLVCALSGSAASPMTRGQFMEALWQEGGSVPSAVPDDFSDVTAETDCASAVGWAVERRLTQGTGDSRFEPERAITREEAAVILRRWATVLQRDTFLPDGLASCNEYEGISFWADDSLYWATDAGLIPWSDGGRLDPTGYLSRLQLNQILNQFNA